MTPLFNRAAALLVLLATANCSVLFNRSAHRQSFLRKDHDGIGGEDSVADLLGDPESLLGKEEVRMFEQLQPKDKRQQLSDLVSEKIDQDRDGFVTYDEMVRWLSFVRHRYLQEESKQLWDKLGVTPGQQLTWLDYKSKVYGKEEWLSNDTLLLSIIAQDLRRFKAADQDRSSGLSADEFVSFRHPEEFVHMRPTVMLDAMDDVDVNRDGFVDEDEYIRAMWQPEQNETTAEEPEWVIKERLLFKRGRDLDQDGKLNTDEVQHWAAPLDRNRSHLETQHLIGQSDMDKDGKLTVVEILNKFDLFVRSEATDYGEALASHHDEL